MKVLSIRVQITKIIIFLSGIIGPKLGLKLRTFYSPSFCATNWAALLGFNCLNCCFHLLYYCNPINCGKIQPIFWLLHCFHAFCAYVLKCKKLIELAYAHLQFHALEGFWNDLALWGRHWCLCAEIWLERIQTLAAVSIIFGMGTICIGRIGVGVGGTGLIA